MYNSHVDYTNYARPESLTGLSRSSRLDVMETTVVGMGKVKIVMDPDSIKPDSVRPAVLGDIVAIEAFVAADPAIHGRALLEVLSGDVVMLLQLWDILRLRTRTLALRADMKRQSFPQTSVEYGIRNESVSMIGDSESIEVDNLLRCARHIRSALTLKGFTL